VERRVDSFHPATAKKISRQLTALVQAEADACTNTKGHKR